jgi:putative Holliday junction resolvase
MRIMGLDLGTKTIGVAVSDETGLIARGVETIHRHGLAKDMARLHELVEREECGAFVLGYPKNMNGSVGERAKASEEFAALLKEQFPSMEVTLWDERLSTVAAEKVLIEADLQRRKRRKIIDMMAAVVILQNYLDSRRR